MEDGIIRVLGPVRDLATQMFSPCVQLLGLKGDLGHVVMVYLDPFVYYLVVWVLLHYFDLFGFVDNYASCLRPDTGFRLVYLSFEH